MRIWLDMANSPHPVLFRAVARELVERGHELNVTTRDHAQTRELTQEAWPDAVVIGDESPGSLLGKAANIGRRVEGLRRWVHGRQVDVAGSLNSYAQIVAARIARIPTVTLMDYEFQPANHLSFRLATRIVVPAAFPAARLRTYGARPSRVTRFERYKEELYADDGANGGASPFASDPGVRAVFRPPAHGALYHRGA